MPPQRHPRAPLRVHSARPLPSVLAPPARSQLVAEVLRGVGWTAAGAMATGLLGCGLRLPATGATVLAPPLKMGAGVFVPCVLACLCLPPLAQSLWVQAGVSVGMGVVLAPVWGLTGGVIVSWAAFATVLAVGLQVGLGTLRQQQRAPTLAAMAPTMAVIAMLLAASQAAAVGAMATVAWAQIVATGAVAWAAAASGLACTRALPLLMSRAHLHKFRVDPSVVATRRLQGLSPHPTVCNTPPQLVASLRRLMGLSPGQVGLPVYLLEGQSGVGKTLMAQGIAEALGAQLYMATANRLQLHDMPMLPLGLFHLTALLAQADLDAQMHRRPTVLVVDEADRLLSLPASADVSGFAEQASVVAHVVFALRLLALAANRVTVVFVTNNAAPMATWIRLAQPKHIVVAPLTASARLQVARLELVNLADALASRGKHLPLLDGPEFEAWCAIIRAHPWHGRALSASVACIARTLDSAAFDGVPCDAATLSANALRAGWRHLATQRFGSVSKAGARLGVETEAEAAAAAPQLWEPQGLRLASLFAQLADLRRMMTQVHLDPAKFWMVHRAMYDYDFGLLYLWLFRRQVASARR